jgi:hypothetical protein
MAPTWKDKGIVADLEGYFFKPQLPKDYFYIGGYGAQKESGKHCVKIARSSPSNPKTAKSLLVPPKEWTLIWRSVGSNARNHGSMWRAVPPSKDYTCIGSIARTGYDKPNLPNYRCVRSILVDKVSSSTIVWSDEGSNADEEVTVFKLPNSNSFVAVKGRMESFSWFDIKTDPTAKPNSKTVDTVVNKRLREIAEVRKREEERRIAEEQRIKVEKTRKLELARKKAKETRKRKLAARKREETKKQAELANAKNHGFSDVKTFRIAKKKGFIDGNEYKEAASGGFSNRAEFIEAKAQGFAKASNFSSAKQGGFTDAREYQEAADGGFIQRTEFVEAKAQGFAKASKFRSAKLGGFTNARDYQEAVNGGFTKHTEFN